MVSLPGHGLVGGCLELPPNAHMGRCQLLACGSMGLLGRSNAVESIAGAAIEASTLHDPEGGQSGHVLAFSRCM
jgi:hypothetical protein